MDSRLGKVIGPLGLHSLWIFKYHYAEALSGIVPGFSYLASFLRGRARVHLMDGNKGARSKRLEHDLGSITHIGSCGVKTEEKR